LSSRTNKQKITAVKRDQPSRSLEIKLSTFSSGSAIFPDDVTLNALNCSEKK